MPVHRAQDKRERDDLRDDDEVMFAAELAPVPGILAGIRIRHAGLDSIRQSIPQLPP